MSIRYLIAAALLVAAPVALPAQSVKAGIEAWQRADYAAAVAIWRPPAEKGDPDASFNLGQAYRLGRGVPTNLASAQTWFERAAEKGHVDAQTTLGLLLFQNGDQENGLRWLKAAADKGEPRALLVYGTALVNGDGVTQDPVLGYAYVSRAAAQGLAPAKETLKELDKLLPLADRKKGVAIARVSAKSAPRPKSKSSPKP
jgi:TPR repeat protein